MKTKKIIAFVALIVSLGLLASCELVTDFIDSRTRPIPLIQIYNSHLENTRKMIPNDTLYVQVQGLAPDTLYKVECLDPADNLITMFIAPSDENGVIGTRPLWYDIGFKSDEDGNMILIEGDLMAKTFYIRVTDKTEEDAEEARSARAVSSNTDFRLPFFFITTNEQFDRPQPIIMAGKQYDGAFVMENAFYTDEVDVDDVIYPLDYEGTPLTNKLYINVQNMTQLVEGSLADDVRIWILPFSGENYVDGDQIADRALFYKEYTVQEIMDAAEGQIPSRIADPDPDPDTGPAGLHIPWPVDQPSYPADVDTLTNQDEIPGWAQGQAFSVFLDMMDGGDESGTYNVKQEGYESYYLDSIDGNGVAGFIVKEPPPLVPADYVPMQLASGGVFGGRYVQYTYTYTDYWGNPRSYNYWRYEYTYDYRDNFIASGNDTKYSSHSGIFWGRGVKVIWNPYRTPAGWQATGHSMPSNFWGRYVDVYIVPADHSLNTGAPIVPAPDTYKCTLPVQYGCSNGYWQQTIWRAPMTVGDYMLIVDMDRSGTITDSDLVDNVRGDSGNGGFSVY